MLDRLKAVLGRPRPSGPPETVRRFQPSDPTLSQDGVRVESDGWVIESTGRQTVRLFEIADPQAEACLLSYRAKVKTDALAGDAYLEMWCRLPGGGEYFSRGVDQAVGGTTDWSSHEIPFYLKRGQRPDLVKLNLVIQGPGTVWIKDIEVLRASLKA